MTRYATDVTDNENFGLALDMQVTISVAALDTTKTKPGRIHSKAGKPVIAPLILRLVLLGESEVPHLCNTNTKIIMGSLHSDVLQKFSNP